MNRLNGAATVALVALQMLCPTSSSAAPFSDTVDFNNGTIPTGWTKWANPGSINNVTVTGGKLVVGPAGTPTEGGIYRPIDTSGVGRIQVSFDAYVDGPFPRSFGAGVYLFDNRYFTDYPRQTTVQVGIGSIGPSFTSAILSSVSGRSIYSDFAPVAPPNPSSTMYHVVDTYTNGQVRQVWTDSSGQLVKDQVASIAGFSLSNMQNLYVYGGVGSGGATSTKIDNIQVIATSSPTGQLPVPTLTSSTLQFANGSRAFGMNSYAISFDALSRRFVLDFPIYVRTSFSSVNAIVDTFLNGINDTWSSFDLKDQNGFSYDFDFNARRVNSEAEATSVINIANRVGSPNPPCRFSDPNPQNCNVPHVKLGSPEMVMFGTLQYFCYVEGSNTDLKDCVNSPMAPPLMNCLDGDGNAFFDRNLRQYKCYDITAVQPFVAAHEFGHILGLPDEYAPSSKNILCQSNFNLFDRNVLFGLPDEQCLEVGLMGDFKRGAQERYYNFLFDNLTDATPEFQWTFGRSPDWFMDGFPQQFASIVDVFEYPVQLGSNSIPVPPSLALVTLGLFGLRWTRRDGAQRAFAALTAVLTT
ncbi:MAG: hypothetical protein JNM79_07005 [Burkholderiales bacterium]|nr:hypothetical protein [Burkholderiales bacterium]